MAVRPSSAGAETTSSHRRRMLLMGEQSVDGGGRLSAIDAFRGFALVMMLLTPFTGSADSVAVLRHAEWDGITIADVVFPTFLVGSGISLALLLRNGFDRAIGIRLVRRFALLVVTGLGYNAYGAIVFGDGALRLTGVLQTIAVAGAIAAVILFASSLGHRPLQPRWPVVAVAAAVILAIYQWVGSTRSCESNLDADRCSVWFGVDRAVFSDQQLYRGGTLGFDPEGVVMMIVASTLVLAGWGVGRWTWTNRSRPIWCAGGIVVAGVSLMAVGLVLDIVADPINKRLFTTSFVVFVAGAAFVTFAAVYLVVDVVPRRKGQDSRRPVVWVLVAFGRNALVVFLLERFILQTSVLLSVGDDSARSALLTWMPGDGVAADMALSVALTSLIGVVVCALHARRRYLVL